MRAKVSIYDDKNYPEITIDLAPSKVVDMGHYTKYLFQLEYSKLNDEVKEDISVLRKLAEALEV